ncbi:MAG TPA: hypothetical protein VJ044_09280, partial [Candidatus Hodarchaeales archaeon]|nr:hypothetical protein [Candidatus Hodarchaeales archaeon]
QMKYLHPDYEVVINASGGHRILESMGFKSEAMTEYQVKRAEKISKVKEYFAKRKAEKEQQEKDLWEAA